MSDPTLAEQIAARCVHFTGISNRTCKAGVEYESVRVRHEPIEYRRRGTRYTSSVSFPCNRNLNHCGATCEHAHFPSQEEAESQARRHNEEIAEFLKNAAIARDAILRATGNKGGAGTVPCPQCGGTLRYRQAACNGHVHARCDTPDCLAWME